MIYFPNMTMKRYTRTTNPGGGVYGETIDQYTYTDDITVDFQNEGNNEIAERYGVERKNLYKIYVDESTPLCDDDVLVDPDDNQYTVIGEVQLYNHFHHYKRAHLIHNRGDSLCQ